VQTTFLHAFRALQRGTIPHIERAWLTAIAQNVCRTMQRSSSRRRNVETNADPELIADASPAAQPVPDEIVGLEQALARIPANQRRALMLREWQGLRYHEIANVMGMSQSAVEMLAFRARKSLSESLNAERSDKRTRIRQALDAGGVLSALRALLAGGSGVHALAGAGVAGLALATVGATHSPAEQARHSSSMRHQPALVTTTAHPLARRRRPIGAGHSRSSVRRATPAKAIQSPPARVESPPTPPAQPRENAPQAETASTTPAQPHLQAPPDPTPPQAPVTVPATPQLPTPAAPQVQPTVDLPSLPVTLPVSVPAVPSVNLPTP